jgi:succinate dehydrogenase / fumarate reductase cytochrome b subunit
MEQAEKKAAKPSPLASVLSIFNTSIGQKIITGLTGLGLVGFLIGHLAGNLSIFAGSEAFNSYAHKLESLGFILYAVEIGLLAVFVFHIIFALSVTATNKGARKTKYVDSRPAGKPSRKSISSQTMIYTGIVLGLFTIIHVWMFKFGPGMNQGYSADLHGVPARDLYRLVIEKFKNPWIMGSYAAVMLLLGVHVRHGFWSAFQSLGGYHPRYTPLIYSLGILIAVLFAIGFLVMPVYIYFFTQMPAL